MQSQRPQVVVTDPTEVYSKLLAGLSTMSKAVSSTLGPMGRNVIIETPYGATTVTKDGVTVASVMDLPDPIENLAAQIVKQAASRTAKAAGDGTTTSTLLTYALVNAAYPLILTGTPPIEIKRTYEAMLTLILDYLDKNSSKITLENIGNIATISANNDPVLGSLISRAYNHVSLDGIIALEDSPTSTTDIELVDGAYFDRGYLSHYFITEPASMSAILDNPYFLITDQKIRSTQELAPILNKVAPTGRPLVIIADEIEGQALQVLIINKLQGSLKSLALKAPSFAHSRLEIMQDLAALTSADFISSTKGQRLEDVEIYQLGTAERVIATDSRTTIISPNRNVPEIEERVTTIHNRLQEENISQYDKEKLQTRLANLATKIALIKIGAATETEVKEKKDRLDDALKATRAAVQKGYLPGGGVALLRAATSITPQTPSERAFLHALHAPFDKILENASIAPAPVKDKVLQSDKLSFGYNSYTSEYENLALSGVIDPTLVLTEALKNATSAANMIILSSTAMYAVDRKPPYNPHDDVRVQ